MRNTTIAVASVRATQFWKLAQASRHPGSDLPIHFL